MRLRSASSLKPTKVANNEVIIVNGDPETNSEHRTKIVYTRRRKKAEPVRDVTGGFISSLPFNLSNIPQRPRTKKRKFKDEDAPPRPRLNSGVFDNNLAKIWNSFSEDKRKPFAYFDSLWFSLYRRPSSKDKVLTWIKKAHIFSKEYVFVPIVCWGHWSLLIFCHFGESMQSTTRSRCMLLLDSLEMMSPRRLEPDIRKFVLDIYKAWDRPETKKIIYQIPLLVPKVPQQRDGNECGNFVLYFINLFLKLAPENFSMDGYPYFMKKDWFTFEDIDRFSERLDSLN